MAKFADLYAVYGSTFEELTRVVARQVGSDELLEVCSRIQGLPDSHQRAALLALEHVSKRAPKRSAIHFAREIERRATG